MVLSHSQLSVRPATKLGKNSDFHTLPSWIFINGTFRHFQIPEFRKACYLLTSFLAAVVFASLSHTLASKAPGRMASGFGQRRGNFIGLQVLSIPSRPPQGPGHRFHAGFASVNSQRNSWRKSWDGLGRDKTQGIRKQPPEVPDRHL